MMKVALGNSFMIFTIPSNFSSTPFLKVDLPELNRIVLAKSSNFFSATLVITGSGHPLLDAGPASVLQLSSLSNTPSPSVSGQGHPPF